MRSALLIATFSALFSPFMLQAQESKKMDIEISTAVLSTAEWANFKYMENLDLAQSGDQKAIKAILEFSRTVDGTEAILHAVTCVELIPFASDEKMGMVISTLKPKLIKVLLDRFQLGQARSQKADLRKPLLEWAPLTWKALNGERVDCHTCMHEGELKLQKPGMSSKPGATSPQDSAPANDAGKQ